MKIFIVTLMLFLLKGWEVNAVPVHSERTQSEPLVELAEPPMNDHNQNGNFANLPDNITEILQQRIEALGSQFADQIAIIKDHIVSQLTQIETENIGLPKDPASPIIQQFEALKRNIHQWTVNAVPVNTTQIFQDRLQEEVIQRMEQLQRILTPLISTFQGTLQGAVENIHDSVSTEIRKIKKLATESESAIKNAEETT
ncbi:uncharacterized protein LOC144608684 [Rhinoraja longicauda]